MNDNIKEFLATIIGLDVITIILRYGMMAQVFRVNSSSNKQGKKKNLWNYLDTQRHIKKFLFL